MIRAVASPEAASRACSGLIDLLPDWFGLSDSNAATVAGVAGCICHGAFDPSGVCVGPVALRPQYGTALKVWWMAVAPDRNRQGIGAKLMAAADAEAPRLGCPDMVVMTIGAESDDTGYAATRHFHLAQGFRPLAHDHIGDPESPLIRMIRRSKPKE